MTIQDLLDMGYDINSEIVLYDYDEGELYEPDVGKPQEGCEKLVVLSFGVIYDE